MAKPYRLSTWQGLLRFANKQEGTGSAVCCERHVTGDLAVFKLPARRYREMQIVRPEN